MGDGTSSKGGTPGATRRFFSLTLGLALAALLAVALLACGSNDDSTSTTVADGEQPAPPNAVPDDDVAAQEAGSPGRALLEWWQAVQAADGAKAAKLTSPETLERVGEADFKAYVKRRGKGLQGIDVYRSIELGDEAGVRAGLLTYQPDEPGGPPPSDPTAARPITFVMVDDGGEWLFSGGDYLEPIVENFIRAEAKAKKQQQKQEE